MIMNGVGVIGRVIPGFLADKYVGPLNVVSPAAGVCTILLFCWMAIKTVPALYVWAVFYGTCFPFNQKLLSTQPPSALH